MRKDKLNINKLGLNAYKVNSIYFIKVAAF
jgi:hypothetical protein